MTWRDKLALGILTYVGGPIWAAFCYCWLWYWFVVPLHQSIPVISIAWTFGITLLIRGVAGTLRYKSTTEQSWYNNKEDKRNMKILWFVTPTILLAYGWIAQYLMNNFGW